MLVQRLRRFRFDWRLSLLVALLLPLTLSLGFWQLRRGAEKAALQAVYDARQYEEPVTLQALGSDGDLQYRKVRFRGSYDNAHVFLLDNRLYQGRPGYEVVVPVHTSEGLLVLVNRGWIAQGASRGELPAIEPVTGEVAVAGSIYQAVGDALVLGNTVDNTGWPKVVETLDIAHMAQMAGHEDNVQVFPHTVRLADNATGVLVRYWPVVSVSPERHQGYAVQWFAMSLALVLLYLYYSTRPETTTDDKQP